MIKSLNITITVPYCGTLKKNEDGTADAHFYLLQFGIRKGTNELVIIQ